MRILHIIIISLVFDEFILSRNYFVVYTGKRVQSKDVRLKYDLSIGYVNEFLSFNLCLPIIENFFEHSVERK